MIRCSKIFRQFNPKPQAKFFPITRDNTQWAKRAEKTIIIVHFSVKLVY